MIQEAIEQHREDIKKKIADCLEIAVGEFQVPIDYPKLSFKLKSNRLAGTHSRSKRMIRINPWFLKEYSNKIINETVPHEIAHYIAHQIYGNVKSHGPEWKRVMRLFGLAPNRCHTCYLKDKPRKTKTRYRYLYECSCCKKEIKASPTVHNRILKGREYSHKGCEDGGLNFTGTRIVL